MDFKVDNKLEGEWYEPTLYPFHLYVICAASVKFSPVADAARLYFFN